MAPPIVNLPVVKISSRHVVDLKWEWLVESTFENPGYGLDYVLYFNTNFHWHASLCSTTLFSLSFHKHQNCLWLLRLKWLAHKIWLWPNSAHITHSQHVLLAYLHKTYIYISYYIDTEKYHESVTVYISVSAAGTSAIPVTDKWYFSIAM